MFSDALNHPSVVDACPRAGVGDVRRPPYRRRRTPCVGSVKRPTGRAALIVTEGVFALDGSTAPLEAIVGVAHRFDVSVRLGARARPRQGSSGTACGAVTAAGLRGLRRRDHRQPRHRAGRGRRFRPPRPHAGPGPSSPSARPARLGRWTAGGTTGSRRRDGGARSAALTDASGSEKPAGQRRRAAHRARARGLRPRLCSNRTWISIVVGDAAQAIRIAELALEQGVDIGAGAPAGRGPRAAPGCACLSWPLHMKLELRDHRRAPWSVGRCASASGSLLVCRLPRPHSSEVLRWGKTRPMDLDLLVIASGPGGQRTAIRAAKLGRRVAVVERRELLRGVSIRTGIIPFKACARWCSTSSPAPARRGAAET